ncbi:MAG: cytochrome c biogenesis protein CcdA [Bacteroidales bacterium]|nr:cytochrome c biogenesis protein CcdA [Bacteroidales bacterium]
MKSAYKSLYASLTTLVIVVSANAQIVEPVKWSFSAERTSIQEATVVFTATIDDGWYLYSQHLPEGGPVPTNFNVESSTSFQLVGKVVEPKPIEKFDPIFKMDLKYFKGKVSFVQKIRPFASDAFVVKGYLEFMCCNNVSCLPPTPVEFSINVPAFQSAVVQADDLQTIPAKPDSDSPIVDGAEQGGHEKVTEPEVIGNKASAPKRGVWYILVAGFLGGLLALITPCVFPMIPMTVSYFLRGSGNKSKGRRDAIQYGISIIVIYVALGLGVSLLFGADRLNQVATSPAFNIFFFILLVVFAAAFFGAFELTLPSKWTNAIDSKADRTGGFIGVFLMALTLVLVSFSCTGPIIGTLLVEAAVSGSWVSPLLGMTGFATALAIPFTLLAIFPSWLSSMPKSGGWLNSVKVLLAFLLLAFSLKFLSVADTVAQWGLLNRETFLAIWITIFIIMGMYLLGKIKFHHDSDLPYISVPRLFLAIISFAFAIYLIPGMWGAPLKAISSFAPPLTTQRFDLNKIISGSASPVISNTATIPTEYKTKEGVYGLIKFLDYEQGLQYARNQGKPVFLDFTGLGCVNCRKMESFVWSDPNVLQRLRDDYIIISLYVDDRTMLPDNEQYTSTIGGKERRIRTVGNKWSDFQAKNFGINSQPYYVLLDHNAKPLAKPYGFNSNIEDFVTFLDQGKAEYLKR